MEYNDEMTVYKIVARFSQQIIIFLFQVCCKIAPILQKKLHYNENPATILQADILYVYLWLK